MLKFPKSIKFKSPHLHLSKKGLKGYKNTENTIEIKTKQDYLMTPQQRGFVDVFCKSCKRDYGYLNIRFSQIYHVQKNVTNPYG